MIIVERTNPGALSGLLLLLLGRVRTIPEPLQHSYVPLGDDNDNGDSNGRLLSVLWQYYARMSLKHINPGF